MKLPLKPAAAGQRARSRTAALNRQVSLCETLDRVFNKGAVIAGDIIISVADVDLLYLGLNLTVCSVETMRLWANESAARQQQQQMPTSGQRSSRPAPAAARQPKGA